MRTFDVQLVKSATSQYSDEIVGFNPEEWLAYPGNVALINDNLDVALFEEQSSMEPGTYCAHYFFWSRGKHAIKAAEEFLEEIFSEEYNVDTLIGITPLDHKGALWMNKRIGFKEHGTIDTVIGPCMFILMTKQQWKDSK